MTTYRYPYAVQVQVRATRTGLMHDYAEVASEGRYAVSRHRLRLNGVVAAEDLRFHFATAIVADAFAELCGGVRVSR